MQPIPMTSGDVVWANDNATLVRAAQLTTTQHHLAVHTTGSVALLIVTCRPAKLRVINRSYCAGPCSASVHESGRACHVTEALAGLQA